MKGIQGGPHWKGYCNGRQIVSGGGYKHNCYDMMLEALGRILARLNSRTGLNRGGFGMDKRLLGLQSSGSACALC